MPAGPVHALALALAVTALVAAGCSGDDEEAPAASSPPGVVLGAGTDTPSGGEPAGIVAGDLLLGDCVDVTGFRVGRPLEPPAVRRADCAAPHGAEVFGALALPGAAGAAFPGTASLGEAATDRCVSEFAAYTGSAYEASALDVATVVPDVDTWNRGDRAAVCLAYDANLRPLTAPVRNTRR